MPAQPPGCTAMRRLIVPASSSSAISSLTLADAFSVRAITVVPVSGLVVATSVMEKSSRIGERGGGQCSERASRLRDVGDGGTGRLQEPLRRDREHGVGGAGGRPHLLVAEEVLV